jgi:flagellar FliL protein
MAEETTAPAAPGEPAKKKSRKLLIVVLLVLIMLGGGGGFYYWRTRAASKAQAAKEAAAKKEKPDDPHGKSETATGGDAGVTQVIELAPFIINLADKTESRYLRMTISLGVAGEAGAEAKVDPLFTTKVRNAVLATISTRTSEDILTVEGKAALRKDMLSAARDAASKPEVLAIYITDFIIQM